jgi:hypothetical protein
VESRGIKAKHPLLRFGCNMLDLKDSQIEELKKFYKSHFNTSLYLLFVNELKRDAKH